ncbi:aldo/keto reductase [Desulfonatronum thiodismutans]|uniref:aldo/keto reductase n=1 Tax=Desulfonatronum thiodismutans TaxID=159290 RepID=UPI0004ABE4E1|nr:aldo/keto reductase [Desulfonatronum thiodismutans]
MTISETITIPQVPFGSIGVSVTRVGLGGEGVLRTHGREEEARSVIEKALDLGIGYYDTAPAYSGSENYLGSVWKSGYFDRNSIFQTSKSASRDYDGAMRDLRETLSKLGTDHLDLWQIHDVRTMGDFAEISGPGGALQAFIEAKESGLVRHIGVTGHHDPEVLTKCVEEWPLDSVLLPVNPVEGILGGFLTKTLPAAKSKGMAVIAMKVLGGGHYLVPEQNLTAPIYLRYALSQPVDVVIVGCSTPAEVEELALAAHSFVPMSREDQQALLEGFRPHARSLAFYRGR